MQGDAAEHAWRLSEELRVERARLRESVRRVERAAAQAGARPRTVAIVIPRSRCPDGGNHSHGRANGCAHSLSWTGERLAWDGRMLTSQEDDAIVLAASHVGKVIRVAP